MICLALGRNQVASVHPPRQADPVLLGHQHSVVHGAGLAQQTKIVNVESQTTWFSERDTEFPFGQ